MVRWKLTEEYMKTKITLIRGDITELDVDAIVNAANESLLGGGGVDGAIHDMAGPKLLEECMSLKGCKTGEAKITNGYDLLARYVIHTVGPVWTGGSRNEPKLLENCYINSLKLAEQFGLKTIAFPAISTGVYGFPIEKATKIAIETTTNFLKDKDSSLREIIFVCFSQRDYSIYQEIAKELVYT